MRWSGAAIVPGVAQGLLWMPSRASEADGSLEDLQRARGALREDAAALPAGLADFYGPLLDDPLWSDGVRRRLEAGERLGPAVTAEAAEAAASLAALDDPYLRSRAADVEQLGAQLVRMLGRRESPPAEAVIVARDVSPLELHAWAKRVSGLVLLDVAPTAHLAIVARGLGVPALGLHGAAAREVEAAAGERSTRALLEAFEGWLELEPPPAVLAANPPRRVVREPDGAPVFVAGRKLAVYANVNLADDALLGAMLGADGVGLVRTEFLYVDRATPPPFAEERAAYARIAAAFAGKPLVVRTLDLGADKPVPWLEAGNGPLTARGIGLLLEHPNVFADHVAAILEGFAGSDLHVMFPMIGVPVEFERARDAVAAVAREHGLPLPELGFMLEVPAAAYALDAFARAGARFASIGTNDLEQFFFAADRFSASGKEEGRALAWERFLREAVQRARDAGLRVGVCGEAASDPALATLWIESGVDSLSVAPGLVPWLKSELRSHSAVREGTP
jgi:phosphoenolpyruvate-protein kinase (PTS system EI component)